MVWTDAPELRRADVKVECVVAMLLLACQVPVCPVLSLCVLNVAVVDVVWLVLTCHRHQYLCFCNQDVRLQP